MDNKLVSIGKAAKMLGVSTMTLRRWDKSGKFEAMRTPTGRRVYLLASIEEIMNKSAESAAKNWVTENSGSEPSDSFYCPNGAIFQARLMKFEKELSEMRTFAENYSLISAAVGEIGNNSFDHNLGNWIDVPGIFFSYDLAKGEIILADRGQGILKTLKRVRPDIQNDAEALRVAFTEVVSGRAPEERGNGLKFVRKTVVLTNINLGFQTGNSILKIGNGSSDLKIISSKYPIRGCLVTIKLL